MKFNYFNTYNKHAIANITIVNGQYIVDGSLPNEVWKPVTFNDGYLISSYGRGIKLATDKVKNHTL